MRKTRKPKVFWTDAERDEIITQAAALREERPDLASLPLLRASQSVLPPDRRRSVVALSQAQWFEPSLKAEIERRNAYSTVPISEVMSLHRARVDEYCDHAEAYHSESLSVLNEVVMLLAIIEKQLRAIAGLVPAAEPRLAEPNRNAGIDSAPQRTRRRPRA